MYPGVPTCFSLSNVKTCVAAHATEALPEVVSSIVPRVAGRSLQSPGAELGTEHLIAVHGIKALGNVRYTERITVERGITGHFG